MNFAAVVRTMTTARSVEQRVSQYDWKALSQELSSYGCAVMKKLLSPEECREIARLYDDGGHFRSHIHMARHGFGKGEYRYFKYPLPDLFLGLRTAVIHASLRSPMIGTSAWELIIVFLSATLIS